MPTTLESLNSLVSQYNKVASAETPEQQAQRRGILCQLAALAAQYGIRRQIARANKWHPIMDRATIATLMPGALFTAKQVKRQIPRMRYRNVEVTENGLRVNLPISGQE